MVITDYNLKDYMHTDRMIRAGGDINLSGGKEPLSQTSDTDITAIRRAAKNILYTTANSCAMNGYGEGIVWGYTTPWWIYAITALDAFVILLTLGFWAYKRD
jgi:beta-glucosidase